MELFPLKTPRLTLRRFQLKDLDAFVACRSDKFLARYQGWSRLTHREGVIFISKQTTQPFGELGQWLQIAIADRESDELLGDIGIHWLQEEPTVVEIGYTLIRRWHKRGLATEAIGALIDLFFNRSNINVVRAITDVRNKSSIALLRRLKFELQQTKDTVFQGKPCTEHTFILRKPEPLMNHHD